MADSDSLEGIRGLYKDLVALSESRLPMLDRLVIELEGRIADFRRLLDKSPRNDGSRQALNLGMAWPDDFPTRRLSGRV